MLALLMELNEVIVIAGNTFIQVIRIDITNDQVRFGITSPSNIIVDRKELYERKLYEKAVKKLKEEKIKTQKISD